MNSKQTNKKNMYNKLLVFFAANASVWAAFTRLVDEIMHFGKLNKKIDDAANLQGGVTTGITGGKNELRKKMATLLVRNARKARVWAHDAGNFEAEAIFNVQKDDFTLGKEEESITHARVVQKALEDNAANLGAVNVSSSDISDSGKSIDNFETALGTPGAAEGKKKAGTETLVELFDAADTSLDLIDDLLIHEYEESNPLLVEEYRNDRKIDNIGIHHTGLMATVVLAGTKTPVKGVKMTIVELAKAAESDIKGLTEIVGCKPGEYHVKFTGAIVPVEMVVKLPQGHIVKMSVEVSPNP